MIITWQQLLQMVDSSNHLHLSVVPVGFMLPAQQNLVLEFQKKTRRPLSILLSLVCAYFGDFDPAHYRRAKLTFEVLLDKSTLNNAFSKLQSLMCVCYCKFFQYAFIRLS